jgi:hypothetical protein
MPGFSSLEYGHATLLTGTSALNCASGVIGGSAGKLRDTLFLGCYVDLTAVTAATLTITGLGNSAAPPIAATWVINGQTTIDGSFFLPWPLLNEFAAYTFQPSVSNVVWVYTRAYTGG